MTILFILLVIVDLAVVIGLWGVGIYNGLVTARNASRTRSPESTFSFNAAST